MEINHIIVFYQQMGGKFNGIKLAAEQKGLLVSMKNPLFYAGFWTV